ncbi:MAG: hypothetical protein DSM106950_44275 [Stigonema ocellatum SAG 48.90 = DSM 106950]|nr:hypothetical protein [Stigonema ocellatum SAG 48.90 = DSM 106950]
MFRQQHPLLLTPPILMHWYGERSLFWHAQSESDRILMHWYGERLLFWHAQSERSHSPALVWRAIALLARAVRATALDLASVLL